MEPDDVVSFDGLDLIIEEIEGWIEHGDAEGGGGACGCNIPPPSGCYEP